MLPRARHDDLLVQQVEEELVLYDQKRHRAHRLNRTAALVWQHCDGKTNIRELAQSLATELAQPVDDDLVELALSQLEQAYLLQEPVARRIDEAWDSRRVAVRRLARAGGFAFILPAVSSIQAPMSIVILT